MIDSIKNTGFEIQCNKFYNKSQQTNQHNQNRYYQYQFTDKELNFKGITK